MPTPRISINIDKDLYEKLKYLRDELGLPSVSATISFLTKHYEDWKNYVRKEVDRK